MMKNRIQSNLTKQRFSIRKLSIGAASVLIGIAFMSWNDQIVKADDINSAPNMPSVTAQQESKIKDQTQKIDASDVPSFQESKITTTADKVSKSNAVVSNSDAQDKTQLNALNTEKTKQLAKTAIKEQKTSIKQDVKSEVKASDVQNNSKYNTDDWDGNLDQTKGEYTLTRYKGSDLDIYIPNTSDFIKAGKITDGEKVYVTGDLFKTINQSKATSVTIDPDGEKLYARGSLNRAFKGNQSLKHVDLHNLDTSEVTDMGLMFNADKSLEDINLSGWNTSNVTDMQWMLDNIPALKSANLSGWDMSKAAISGIIADNGNLTDLDLSNVNFGVKSTNDTNYVVGGDNKLTNLNLAGAKEVPLSIIQACIQIAGRNGEKDLDLSQIGSISSNITNLNNLFQWIGNVETINLTGWNTSNITSMTHTFANCANLKKVIGLNTWDFSNVTNMNGMFYQDNALTDVDLSGRDLSKVTDMSAMFYGHPKLARLNLSGVTFKDGVNDGMFQGIPGTLVSVDLANTKNVSSNVWNIWKNAFNNGIATELDATQLPASYQFTDYSGLLSGLSNVEKIDMTGFDFSKATSLNNLFNNDPNLNTINLGSIDLSKVGSIDNWFNGDVKLKTIDASNVKGNTSALLKVYISILRNNRAKKIDFSNFPSNLSADITDLSKLFADLPDVEEIDLPNWDTSHVTNMQEMFSGDKNLKTVNLSGWDTSNVTNMQNMFNGDKSLTAVNLNGWKTNNVTNMQNMFSGDSSLTSLNLSSWNTNNVTNMNGIFQNAGSLKSLDISNWNLKNASIDSMLDGDNALTALTLNGTEGVPLSLIKTCIQIAGRNGDKNLDLSQIGSISSNITNLNGLFQWIGNIETINLTGWNTSNITSMDHTFANCANLQKVIGLNTLDLSNVTNMNGMFYQDDALTDVDLSGRDLSKVTDMSAMFYGHSKLERLNLSGVTFKNGVNDGMFQAVPSTLVSVDLANAKNVSKNVWHYYETAFTNSGATELDLAKLNVSFQFTDWSWLLSSLSNVEKINLSGVDFSKVTNLNNLFSDDAKLTAVDLYGADLAKVDDISSMFKKCPKLNTINLSGVTFNESVKNADAFVETNNISNLDLEAAKNIPDAVLRAYVQAAKNSKVTQIDLSNLNLSKNVTNLQGLLAGLPDVKEINLSGMDISNIQKMDSMMSGDAFLERVSLSGLDLSNISVDNLFGADKNLSYLDLSGVTFPDSMNGGTFDNYFSFVPSGVFKEVKLDNAQNIPAVILHAYVLAAANTGAKTISLNNLDISKKITKFNGLFANLPSVETIDITNLPTSNATDMSSMFSNDPSLTRIIGIEGLDTHNVTNMGNMFGAYRNPTKDDYEPQSLVYFGKLTKLDLSNWDTSNVTDMGFMFTGQQDLITIGDLSNWNTAKVTNMCNMFDHLKSLKDGQLAGLKNWDTSKVTDMTYMFDEVTQQTDLNFVNGWDTSNVTDMSYMFADDPNLKSLDLSKWNVGKVGTKKTEQNYSLAMMFANDKALTTVGDISNWDTRNVHDTRWMFYKTKSLKNIDLSGWKTPKLQIAGKMFYGSGVQHVNMSNWNFSHLQHYNNYGFVNRTEGGEIFRGPEGMFAYLINRAVITMNNIKLPDEKNAFIVDDFAGTQPIAVLANDAQGKALPALMALNEQQWKFKDKGKNKDIIITGRQNSNVLTLVKANDSQLARAFEENPKIGEHKLNFVFRDKDDLTNYLNARIAADEIKQDLKNYNPNFDLRTWDQKGDTDSNNRLKASLRLYQPAGDNFLADWVVPVHQLHIVAPKVTPEHKTVTRTITIKNPDGTEHVETQKVTFTRNVTTYVNGDPVISDWDKPSKIWKKYTVPTIPTYTANTKEFAEKEVKPTDQDENYVVTYSRQQSTKKTDSKTITRTITVKNPDETEHVEKQSVTFTRTITTYQDGTIETGAWDKQTGTWPEYTVPTIKGYTPSTTKFLVKTVTPKDHDENYVVTYKKNNSDNGGNGGNIIPSTPPIHKPHTPEEIHVPSIPDIPTDQVIHETKPSTKAVIDDLQTTSVKANVIEKSTDKKTSKTNAKSHSANMANGTVKSANKTVLPKANTSAGQGNNKAKLPQTGARHSAWAMISGLGMITLLALGVVIDRKKHLK